MATEIQDDILTSYKTYCETYKASGEILEWCRHYAVPGETNLMKWVGLLPLILIVPVNSDFEALTQQGTYVDDWVHFDVMLSVILQAFDASHATKSPSVPDYIQAVTYGENVRQLFNRETFDLSSYCICTNMRYGAPSIPGFVLPNEQSWVHGVELTFQHQYQYRRTL